MVWPHYAIAVVLNVPSSKQHPFHGAPSISLQNTFLDLFVGLVRGIRIKQSVSRGVCVCMSARAVSVCGVQSVTKHIYQLWKKKIKFVVGYLAIWLTVLLLTDLLVNLNIFVRHLFLLCCGTLVAFQSSAHQEILIKRILQEFWTEFLLLYKVH